MHPLRGLRERRLFRHITQADMAAMIDMGQSHYRRVEMGEVRLDLHRAKILADCLGCKMEELL